MREIIIEERPTMKTAPTADEIMRAAHLLGNQIGLLLQQSREAGEPHPASTDDTLDAFQRRVRERFDKLLESGEIPDREWPRPHLISTGLRSFTLVMSGNAPTAMEADAGPAPSAEEIIEERARADGAAMWDMVRDAIASLHAFGAQPPCHLVTMGVALYGAMRAEGLEPERALRAAVYQVLNHECPANPRAVAKGAPC